MSDKKDEKKEQAASGKKKPPVMMIILAIAVIATLGGLVVGKQVFAKSKGKGQAHKVVIGPIMPLDDFLVNLADPSGDHFLKVTVDLELQQNKSPDALKDKVAPIRDAVLTALCSKTRDQIAPLTGRNTLKAEIRSDVNAALGENDVKNVYFSDFVTQ